MAKLYKKHQLCKEVIDNTRKARRAPLKSGETPGNQEKTPRRSGQPEEYKAIDDVNVRLDGWLADCNEYGEDVGAAWTRIEQ